MITKKNQKVFFFILSCVLGSSLHAAQPSSTLSKSVAAVRNTISSWFQSPPPPADVQREITPLMRVASRGDWQDAEELLTSGVNIDVQDEWGRTALMIAAVTGHLRTVQILLKYKANKELKDFEGRTALNLASGAILSEISVTAPKRANDPNIIRALLGRPLVWVEEPVDMCYTGPLYEQPLK